MCRVQIQHTRCLFFFFLLSPCMLAVCCVRRSEASGASWRWAASTADPFETRVAFLWVEMRRRRSIQPWRDACLAIWAAGQIDSLWVNGGGPTLPPPSSAVGGVFRERWNPSRPRGVGAAAAPPWCGALFSHRQLYGNLSWSWRLAGAGGGRWLWCRAHTLGLRSALQRTPRVDLRCEGGKADTPLLWDVVWLSGAYFSTHVVWAFFWAFPCCWNTLNASEWRSSAGGTTVWWVDLH